MIQNNKNFDPDYETWRISVGKAAQEEPLLPRHEPGTPENHPRAGRGLRRGERELRQRAQTQRDHHGPQVRHPAVRKEPPLAWQRWLRLRGCVCVSFPCPQREVGLSKLQSDCSDRAGDGSQGPPSHRSYQTAEQQVSVCRGRRSDVIPVVNIFSLVPAERRAEAPGPRCSKRSRRSTTSTSRTEGSWKRSNKELHSGLRCLRNRLLLHFFLSNGSKRWCFS